MKFTAIFNGAQASVPEITQVLMNAGQNTTIIVNTAQSLNSQDIAAIANAAGATKNLQFQINGAQADQAFVQEVLSVAGANTRTSVNTAQALGGASLVAIANSSAGKALSMSFNGAQSSGALIQQFLNAAGPNTSTSVNTAQAFSSAEMAAIANAAGVKPYSPDYNEAQSSGATLVEALNLAGTNTSTSVNTAQSFSDAEWTTISAAAGDKSFAADFNGAQTNNARLLQVIGDAGANTRVSVNTAQALGAADIITAINAAGAKALSLDFNGAQSSPALINQSVNAAGANTSISVNTAQAFSTTEIVNMVTTAGAKSLSLRFNGSQTATADINGALAAAGANISITLDLAQIYSTADLISFVQLAG